jgi:hypothetical protein
LPLSLPVAHSFICIFISPVRNPIYNRIKGVDLSIDEAGNVHLQQVNRQCQVFARPFDEAEHALPVNLRSRSFRFFAAPDENNNSSSNDTDKSGDCTSKPITSSDSKGNAKRVAGLATTRQVLFDLKRFKANVAHLLLKSNAFGPAERTRLERQCACSLIFVRESHSQNQIKAPLWLLFINIVALDHLRSAFFGD